MELQMLTAPQVGKIIGLSKRTVFRLELSGDIPKAVKIGGSMRWKNVDICQWVDQGCPKGFGGAEVY